MEALILLVLLGPPLVAAAVVSFVRPGWVLRISTGSIAVQVGLVLAAWLLLATIPDHPNWNGAVGDTCPNLATVQGAVAGVFALAVLVVGGIAAGSSVVGVVRGAARWPRIVAGLGADALFVTVWVPLLGMAFCGFN
jgi:hypothetical protein